MPHEHVINYIKDVIKKLQDNPAPLLGPKGTTARDTADKLKAHNDALLKQIKDAGLGK